jgi:hypothetical protein
MSKKQSTGKKQSTPTAPKKIDRKKAYQVEKGVKYFAEIINVDYINKKTPSKVYEEKEVLVNLRSLLEKCTMEEVIQFSADLGILLEVREDSREV